MIHRLERQQVELEQVNRGLAEREARLTAIVASEPECVKLIAADGSLLEMNPAGLRMLEADSFQQVQNQSICGLVDVEHREAFRGLVERVFSGESGTLEFSIVGMKGGRRWLETHASPLREPSGAVSALLGITRDVTERKQAEAALRESEATFRAICEASPAGIFLARPDGQISYGNPANLRLTGLSWEEATGTNWVTAIHPDDRARVLAEWQRCQTEGRTYSGTTRHLRGDGQVAWWHVTTAPVRDGDILLGYVGLAMDVTGRERANEALRAREARYLRQRNALIGLTSRTPVYRHGLESVLKAITESAARTLGVERVSIWRYNAERSAIHREILYSPEDNTPSFLTELHRSAYPTYFREIDMAEVVVVDDALSDARTAELVNIYLRPLGITSLLVAPVRGAGDLDGFLCLEHVGPGHAWSEDEKVFAVAIANLVSLALEGWQRQRAEADLREARDRLKLAVSAGKVGLWDRDLRTGRVRFSPEWKQQIGYGDDELADDFNEWQSRIHPDDRTRVLAAERARMKGASHAFEIEFRLRHKDGSYRRILSRGTTVRSDDGTPLRLVGTHVDITDWTELQTQFLHTQKMDSVGQLAGGIAHDFNNLLTVINGTVDLVLNDLQLEELRADLMEIRGAGERAAALTRQLLAFSRKQIMMPEVLDLNAVVLDMKRMLERLIGEQVVLAISPAGEVDAVRADRGQLQQVIMNLAVNARDAMADGGTLTIETRNVELDADYAADHPAVQPGPHVMLAVSDTGTGMDEATLGRIFEPFFTTKGPTHGTGLGLSTVYGIVKQSGGSIGVYSEPGLGTTFRVYLPRVGETLTTEVSDRNAATTQGSETILVVEDDPSIRQLATRLLQTAGYTVLAVGSGPEALSELARRDSRVDLVLTDVVMPGMTGRELAERVSILHPQVKILYTSGYTDDAVFRHGMFDPNAHFISKPYSALDLGHKVREVLNSAH